MMTAMALVIYLSVGLMLAFFFHALDSIAGLWLAGKGEFGGKFYLFIILVWPFVTVVFAVSMLAGFICDQYKQRKKGK